jgi:hypothetical protein
MSDSILAERPDKVVQIELSCGKDSAVGGWWAKTSSNMQAHVRAQGCSDRGNSPDSQGCQGCQLIESVVLHARNLIALKVEDL